MHTVALISRKGGTGKTTLACSLAVAAQSDGRAAVILDMDPQGSATVWGRVRQEQPPAVAATRPRALDGHLQAAKEAGVDVLFIDTAPQVAGAASQAAQAADYVLIPCRPGLLDLAAIAGTAQIAGQARVPSAVVLNAAGIRSPLVVQAQGALLDAGAAIAPVVYQRIGHAYAITAGQTAAEREPGSKAGAEVEALWQWLWKRLRTKRRTR